MYFEIRNQNYSKNLFFSHILHMIVFENKNSSLLLIICFMYKIIIKQFFI